MMIAALLLSTVPLAAQEGDASAGSNRMVCRNLAVTGSRVSRDRVCKTAAEWEAYRQEARRHIEQMQNNRGTAVQDNEQGTGGI